MNEDFMKSPLFPLIGHWEGDKGIDLAPKEIEDENNPYYETLIIEAVEMDLSNAEEQELDTVRYHSTVRQKNNDEISHSEVGYWSWDKNDGSIMCSFAIPRGVAVVAGGTFKKLENGTIHFSVKAGINDPHWPIAQAPFMMKKAKTISFNREFKVSRDTLSYTQETQLEIYGKSFNHSDKNRLIRKSS